MNISLHSPSIEFMPQLLALSKEMHTHEILPYDEERLTSFFLFLIENPSYGDIFLISSNEAQEKNILGFVVISYRQSVEFLGKIAILEQMFLLTEWRRQGVGSCILPLIEAHAISKKCHALTSEVNIANSHVRAFYEQFDYMLHRQHCIISKRLDPKT